MKAIIPMAGSGTRLRPLTYSKPKAMLRVGSQPIMYHIVDRLVPLGCDVIILIISPEGETIPAMLLEHYPNMRIEVIVQEERLGLGHAVSLAAEKVCDDELVVVYGDTIIDGDLSNIRETIADGVIAVKKVNDPRRFGVVNVRNGLITRFVEKPEEPKSNLAIVGLNYFRKPDMLFDCLHEIIGKGQRTRGEFQITDAFQLMLRRGYKFSPLVVNGWFDCGTPASLLETNRFLLSRDGNAPQFANSVLISPVFVPENAHITNSIIGPYVSVGDGAVIDRSMISNSIIGDNARVAHVSLAGSLIGDNAEIVERPRSLIVGEESTDHLPFFQDE
jgi:glucose-1-phosphate thymidylyltransferase